MGVGRIYSIQGGQGYFQNSGGSWLKGPGGVEKFRGGGSWTLDEAMGHISLFNFLTYCQRLMNKFYYFIGHTWGDEAHFLSHQCQF